MWGTVLISKTFSNIRRCTFVCVFSGQPANFNNNCSNATATLRHHTSRAVRVNNNINVQDTFNVFVFMETINCNGIFLNFCSFSLPLAADVVKYIFEICGLFYVCLVNDDSILAFQLSDRTFIEAFATITIEK